MTTPTIRAALQRLVELSKQHAIASVWDGAFFNARAALAAEPVGEGPPAVMASALLHPAYEPGDGSADGAQMVGMAWWQPVMGCDSLQIVVDNARNILRSRWAHPATPPEPKPGEVGELVALIRQIALAWEPDACLLGNMTAGQLARAATLLQQQAAPAPPAPEVVPPISHAERLRIAKRGIRAGYNLGHHHTGLGLGWGDPDELAADYAEGVLEDLEDAPAPAVVAVSDALVEAERALSDIAEGEETNAAPSTFEWAERRCAEALVIIRPVMKQHKVRTSEWPPQPLPQAGEGESVITCRDNPNPVCPICGSVNTEPWDIGHNFELCDTTEVTCGECDMDYTVTRHAVFIYTTETEA